MPVPRAYADPLKVLVRSWDDDVRKHDDSARGRTAGGAIA